MNTFQSSEFDKYKAEAQEKWGQTSAYKEHAQKTKNYTKQTWNDLAEGMSQIIAEFALCKKASDAPCSDSAQALVKALQNHITENYYLCTNEILAGLGQMYVADERFRTNIDRHADGTAEFICQAIHAYCHK